MVATYSLIHRSTTPPLDKSYVQCAHRIGRIGARPIVAITPDTKERIYWTMVLANTLVSVKKLTRLEGIVDTIVQLFYTITSGLIATVGDQR